MAKKAAARLRRGVAKRTTKKGAKKPGASSCKRKSRADRTTRKGGANQGAFAQLKRRGGMGVSVTVVEGAAGAWEHRGETCEVAASKTGGLLPRAVGRLKRVLPRMAPTLAALGHADRARITAKLLEGPATYRALQDLTKMKAGPLYYHLGELRAAGLILPKQRDLYELTRGGRNLALVMVAAESLFRDKRRRPVGVKT